jgi:hypothetical protein
MGVKTPIRWHVDVSPTKYVTPPGRETYDRPWTVPSAPPREWFDPPAAMAPGTRFTILDTGRVYGYLCTRDAVRLADGRTFVPPRSVSHYRRAHQGSVETAEGEIVRVAVIGTRGHHDDPDRYADPERARALVRIHDRDDGVVLAGALVPGCSHFDVLEMRRSALSGDWRGDDLIGIGLVLHPASQLGVAHEVHAHDPVAPARVAAARTAGHAQRHAEGYAAGMAAAQAGSAALIAQLREWSRAARVAGAPQVHRHGRLVAWPTVLDVAEYVGVLADAADAELQAQLLGAQLTALADAPD